MPPLCRAQNAGGGEGESLLPTRSGQRHMVPFLFQSVSSAMSPFPPLLRAVGPCHRGAAGLSRQGLRAKRDRPAVASPNVLGDQMYLMVKGLVPSLDSQSVVKGRWPSHTTLYLL